VETVPRTSNALSEDADDEEDNTGLPYDESEQTHDIDGLPSHSSGQHRLGYFDLHPERRQTLGRSVIDDDNIRAKLAKDDSDEEEEDDDEQVYGPPEVRPLPAPPIAPSIIHEPTPLGPVKSTVSVLNKSAEAQSSAVPLTGNGQSGLPATPSKTAALIEMYRERERGTSPKPNPSVNPPQIVVAPLQPSRLPVRTVSLPKDPKDTSALPQSPVQMPSLRVSPPPEPTLIEPPRVLLEETGRNSPARYKHGAPLHNVIEDPEEEE